jgi:hypothetical protein
MKTYGEWRYSSTILDLSTNLRRVDSFTSAPLYSWRRTINTHWVGGCVGPRAGLDAVEKKKNLPRPGIESGPSLYRLSFFDCCSEFLQGGYGFL